MHESDRFRGHDRDGSHRSTVGGATTTTIQRYAIRLDETLREPVPTARSASHQIEIEPFDAGRDESGVVGLVTACRDHGVGMAAGLRAEGLLAELAGRAERTVRCWVARDEDRELVGLVSLARSGGAERPRFSLPFLLVSPSHRRRGVGWQLVCRAIDAARGLGAVVVHAETRRDWPDAAAFWTRVADTAGDPRRRSEIAP